jgi:TRAP-type C4-dicarboxylate transport system substrate-binding protein
LKWRAYSPATSRIAELVGAQPVTVQASELTQALATGVVESYMSSPSTGFDTKTYESIKTFYDTQAWLPKNAVIVNQQAFGALDKATQDAVLKAAADAEVRGWESFGGKERLVYRSAEAKRHGHRQAEPAAQRRPEESRRYDAPGMAQKKRTRRQAAVDAFRKM